MPDELKPCESIDYTAHVPTASSEMSRLMDLAARESAANAALRAQLAEAVGLIERACRESCYDEMRAFLARVGEGK